MRLQAVQAKDSTLTGGLTSASLRRSTGTEREEMHAAKKWKPQMGSIQENASLEAKRKQQVEELAGLCYISSSQQCVSDEQGVVLTGIDQLLVDILLALSDCGHLPKATLQSCVISANVVSKPCADGLWRSSGTAGGP